MAVTENRTLLEKADLALADLASGGLLVDEQLDQFFRIAIKRQVILREANITTMRNPTAQRPKIRFGSTILRPGVEATSLAVAQRSKPDLSVVTLDAKLFKAEVRLSNEIVEDQVERGNFQGTVMELMAEAVGRDVEDVAINGDTASATPLLAVLDGWLKQATSNVVVGGTVNLDKDILRDMSKTLPDEFADQNLRYWTNRQARIDYRDSLADRATALGDAMLTTQDRTIFMDMPVIGVPLFPNNLGGGSNETNVLLSDPENLLVGFHREVRIETDKDVSAGVIIIVASLRFDVKFMEETAAVKATQILGV